MSTPVDTQGNQTIQLESIDIAFMVIILSVRDLYLD